MTWEKCINCGKPFETASSQGLGIEDDHSPCCSRTCVTEFEKHLAKEDEELKEASPRFKDLESLE